jgi:hypothetical protein
MEYHEPASDELEEKLVRFLSCAATSSSKIGFAEKILITVVKTVNV